MRSSKIGCFLFIPLLFLTFFVKLSAQNGVISEKDIFTHISVLASDSLAGRSPGSVGDEKSVKYISNALNLSEKSIPYIESFDIITGVSAGKNNVLAISEEQSVFEKDFVPLSFSANEQLNAEVVFAGYGFDYAKKETVWNDYAGIDVKNKWVLLLRDEPFFGNTDYDFKNLLSDRNKTMMAIDKGAAGVLLVSGTAFDKDDNLADIKNPNGTVKIPVFQITRATADKILAKSEFSISKLEAEIISAKKPMSFNTGVFVSAKSDVEIIKLSTSNIYTIIEGNDPVLKNEYIVIGAHYDHLGWGGDGSGSRRPDTVAIHYGADDNASGVSAVLEMADILSSGKLNNSRSYILVAFGAEERGLLGSKYFVENPPVPLQNIKAMINLDMIGRLREDNSLQISGVGSSVEADSLLNLINKEYNFKLVFSQEGYGPSDHASFYAKDIPVIYFSTGAHADYHTPEDKAEKINTVGIQTITEFIFALTRNLDKMPNSLTYKEAGPKTSSEAKHGGTRKISLGIMPDFAATDIGGLRAEIVTPGKPAYAAGMKNGDIITAINGNTVGDIQEYMFRLGQLNPGEQITVDVIRGDEKVVLVIQL